MNGVGWSKQRCTLGRGWHYTDYGNYSVIDFRLPVHCCCIKGERKSVAATTTHIDAPAAYRCGSAGLFLNQIANSWPILLNIQHRIPMVTRIQLNIVD